MFSETIELRGHIIDSLILPKVLDQILTHGANFKIGEITIGQKRADQSFARIEVSAETSMRAKLWSARFWPIVISPILKLAPWVKIWSSTFGRMSESMMWPRNSIVSENIDKV